MTRPNVVLMHSDDLGQFLGCYGVPTVRSPRLDAFAADGVRCAQMFCTSPLCSPSRASLFTGRYPQSNGVLGLAHDPFGWDLHDDERHLARELRDAGYATVALGKLHEARIRSTSTDVREATDEVRAAHAQRLGFDEVVFEGVMDARLVADQAIDRLDQLAAADRPFYLQVGFVEPHRLADDRDEPGAMGFLGNHIDPDDELGVTVPDFLVDDASARADVAELQGAVHYMDTHAGRVLDRLAELGLDQNTLVVFTADHGIGFPRAKGSLYDPGLEVPLIVRYPERGWTGARVVDELVSNVDIVPTVLQAAGLPVPDRVEGHSLIPLLDGDDHHQPRTEIFGQLTDFAYYDPRRCIRTNQHKLIVNFTAAAPYSGQSWLRHRSLPKAPYDNAFRAPVELYDLDKDPIELTNLADDPTYAQVRQDLLARVHEWMVQTNDPLLGGAVTSPPHQHALAQLTSTD